MGTQNRNSFFSSFLIKDKPSCAKAMENGGLFTMGIAAMTGMFGLAGLFAKSDNQQLSRLLTPWALVDAGLLVILGFFVFRKSRIASTLLFIYFIIGVAVMWFELGKTPRLFLSIIILLYSFTAMRGTYIWHSTYRKDPQDSTL
jgi:hypothetical protein